MGAGIGGVASVPAAAAYRVLGLIYCLGLLLLTVLHGKSYYALGYYPVLFAAGAVWWERQLEGWPRGQQWLRPALLLLPVLLLVPLLPMTFTLFAPARMQQVGEAYRGSGALRWEDGRDHSLPQDFADMLGWQELAGKTWWVYQQLPPETRNQTLILTANYGQAGAINYYNRSRPMPSAHSFNGSYLLWFPKRPARPWSYLLIIDDEVPDADLFPHFRTLRQVAQVQNAYAREQGAAIYLGTAPDAAILARIYREHAAAKALWESKRP
ncbi:hypothetical protein [Hymenobacter sp. AT01-02]|uniref:hypothetical protein n=1 Tax=Hymenobacter sp. AT01-02 TaxID=1571877 RepID=UPI0006980868|nr:hypothetical protein [Hymenobacter sp. AT01-02]